MVRRTCEEQGCALRVTDPNAEKLNACDLSGQTLDYRDRKDLRLRLLGDYQYKNVSVVLDTVDALNARVYKIPESAVRAGLSEVSWPGRFEVLSKFVVSGDGAHNPDGVSEWCHA